MIRLSSMTKTAILSVITALHKLLDKIESPSPDDVVLINTSTASVPCVASGGGGGVLVYGENTEVQPLSYLDIYIFTDKELITKYFADEAVRDFKATHTYDTGIEKNLDIYVAYSDTTYTCSEDYLLHIYCIGGGGGCVYDDNDISIFGKGFDGTVAYQAYQAFAGETFNITIGTAGTNDTSTTEPAAGSHTTCNSNSTAFSLIGDGGDVGIYGLNYVAPTTERHWHCGNGVDVELGGWLDQSRSQHLLTLRSVSIGSWIYYADSSGNQQTAFVYRSPGICGISGVYNGVVKEGSPPNAGCVIIIRELMC